MKTLVTGAGIIGCHTARLLLEAGDEVTLLDVNPQRDPIASIVDSPGLRIVAADVTLFAQLQQIVQTHGIERIVHTAAMLSTGIRANPVHGITVNVVGTANILEVARQAGMQRVVLAGSTTVAYSTFEGLAGTVVPDDFAMRTISQRPGSIYAATKLHAEHLGLLYRDLYSLDVVTLRYAAVISAWPGPGTSVPGRVLAQLVGPAARGRTAVIDDPYTLWMGGEEFIDARDCALANLAALGAPAPRQAVYAVGMGCLHSFDDFEDAVRRVYPTLRVERTIEPTGGFAGFAHVRQAASDLEPIGRELGWQPQFNLRQAVAHFSAWCAGDPGPAQATGRLAGVLQK